MQRDEAGGSQERPVPTRRAAAFAQRPFVAALQSPSRLGHVMTVNARANPSRMAESPPKIGWVAALSPRFWATPSVIVLIAANLLPLYGVVYWGWDLFALMLLYWMETAIIGFFAIIQMAIAAPLMSIVLVPFFMFHFGAFMFGHLFFLTVLFAHGSISRLSAIPDMLWNLLTEHRLWIALLALFLSHAVSFVLNIVQPKWWMRFAEIEPAPAASQPQDVMTAVYGRVVIMHVTIIFGAMLMGVFGTKAAIFVLLITLKIAVDIAAHVRKNFRQIAKSTVPVGR
jgi:hypothetical protein